jgi:hypothetical protein
MLPCPVLDNDQVAALAEMCALIAVAEICFVARTLGVIGTGRQAETGRAVIADPHRRVRPQRSIPSGLRRSPGRAVRGRRHLRDHQRAD